MSGRLRGSISEEQLLEIERDDRPLAGLLIGEIRRLMEENAELKKKVALLTSDKRDLIEEIEGPVEESW